MRRCVFRWKKHNFVLLSHLLLVDWNSMYIIKRQSKFERQNIQAFQTKFNLHFVKKWIQDKVLVCYWWALQFTRKSNCKKRLKKTKVKNDKLVDRKSPQICSLFLFKENILLNFLRTETRKTRASFAIGKNSSFKLQILSFTYTVLKEF